MLKFQINKRQFTWTKQYVRSVTQWTQNWYNYVQTNNTTSNATSPTVTSRYFRGKPHVALPVISPLHNSCTTIWRAIWLWRHNVKVCQQVRCRAFGDKAIACPFDGTVCNILCQRGGVLFTSLSTVTLTLQIICLHLFFMGIMPAKVWWRCKDNFICTDSWNRYIWTDMWHNHNSAAME